MDNQGFYEGCGRGCLRQLPQVKTHEQQKLVKRQLRSNKIKYCKIPKISPSKYRPPKPVTQKTLPLNRPSKYKPPGTCTWKIALKYIVKQSKNGRFIPSYKASPIDSETQISLRR